MNHLVPTDDGDSDDTWRLPQHAHIVVYEREQGAGSESSVAAENDSDSGSASDRVNDSDTDSRGLLTIYDCGAAQQPPSAQLLGTLESVDASAVVESQPTGRIVKLREEAVLECDRTDRYRIV
ncbi:hypothetical protein C483_14640 [Natrialba hulunbeirensis JCM 10989]|uniref:Uncharacterized protein n=1 Tax=Natrialba hulunbeirensis JCM 10989 TaxID=1227493 RepID=L9ZRR7_9EURY|nr:hypothetical protein [Natrialba hulunbeirensis]ELY89195.1 hypothetical protein C483_14640 [Natrialba hulunbeirensis JCM 10989]